MYSYYLKCPFCKDVAFEYSEMPKKGDILTSSMAWLPRTQKAPSNKERIICDSCNTTLGFNIFPVSEVYKNR